MLDTTSNQSLAQAKVIEANVDFYRQLAPKYECSEGYLFDPLLQRSLESDLDKINSYFAPLGRAPRCLECGGGTGRLTLKMCARGWDVTVVDVSQEMLASLKGKALAMGFFPTLVSASIEQFLATANETYDLVAFSAVLHHLYSYASIVQQAASILRPGGVFYSNHDPVIPKRPFCTRVFESLDIAIAKIMFDRADLLPGIRRRIRKGLTPEDATFARAVVSSGDIAEFHARTGVDDRRILHILQATGFSILEYQRFAIGRTDFTRLLNEHLRLLENFKIVARRNLQKSPEQPHCLKIVSKDVKDGLQRLSQESATRFQSANALPNPMETAP